MYYYINFIYLKLMKLQNQIVSLKFTSSNFYTASNHYGNHTSLLLINIEIHRKHAKDVYESL